MTVLMGRVRRYKMLRWYSLRLTLFGLSVIFTWYNGAAQSFDIAQEYRFERLDEESGLTSGTINGITQDSLGFIWIATEDGLNRYDGRNIKIFRRNDQEKNSLPNNYIQKVHVDEQNRIWALTDYGIGIYNHDLGGFKLILPGTDSTNIQYKSVTSITELNDVFAIGTFGLGVAIYRDGVFSKLMNAPDSDYDIENTSVSAVQFLNESELIIGSWFNGLFLYHLEQRTLRRINVDSEAYRVYDITRDLSGNVWVATSIGIVRLSGNDVKLYGNTFSSQFPEDDYLSVYANADHLWVGMRANGLLRIPLRDLDQYSPELNILNYVSGEGLGGPSSRTVSAIFEDRDGNLWFGTHNGGINILNPDGEIVALYNRDEKSKFSLSLSKVWGLTEDSEGKLWVGTDGRGIDIIDHSEGTVRPFAQNNQLSDQAILCLAEEPGKGVLIGTYSGGIMRYDPIEKKVVPIDGLGSMDIRCIEVLNGNSVFIGTNGGGIYQYNDGVSIPVEATDGLDIRDIKAGENDILWLATYGYGLAKLNMKTKSLSYYNWYQDSEQLTPIVQTMYKSDNHIWLGTKYSGLVLFDTQKETFEIFDEGKGLVNNTVRSIVSDEEGTLWLSTNKGVSAFDLKNKSFNNYNKFDGFQDGQFNDNSGVLLASGKIAFGGIHGLNVFTPDKLKIPEKLPEIVITNMAILSGDDGYVELTNAPVSKEIMLSHNQNFFRVDYSPIFYPFNKKWVVQSKLEGLDNDWTTAGSESNSLLFRGLGFGEYTLRLRVLEGDYTGVEKSLKITIIPPIWLRWYAFLIYFTILVLIVAGIIRYNSRQVSLREKLSYEKRLRLQEKEVLQRKLRFFTNISHEIRTPLTLISGPVQDLSRKHEDDVESQELLSLINRNGELLKKLVDRLLEFRKVETEDVQITLDNHDIYELLQEELESFRYQAASRGITIHLRSETRIFGWVDIEKLQIILNNLLSNAVKYTPDNGEIWLEVVVDRGTLQITVRDNGVGIDKADVTNVFEPFFQGKNSVGKGGTGIGLSLSKRLVEIHRGVIHVHSHSGKGTEFTFSLPIDKQSYIDFPGVRFLDGITAQENSDALLEDLPAKERNGIDDRVLVIADDNKDILQYLKRTFKNDFRVEIATNGSEAWKLILEHIPDLIISDIMMPGYDGLELCSMIRSNEATSHIPVILLTAKDGSKEKIKGFRAGTDQYVTKPFDAHELKIRVKNLIESREQLSVKKHDASPNAIQEDDVDRQFLLKVEKVIFDNLETANFSVNDLARELGFSRTSLYRKLKALTGESINHYIRMVKLRKAAELLVEENANVSTVAFYLGFTDLKYFRACFKEIYGLVPSEYQRKSKETV